jgi:hypothetical protein
VSVGFDAVWLSNLRTGTVWRLPLAGLNSLSGSRALEGMRKRPAVRPGAG